MKGGRTIGQDSSAGGLREAVRVSADSRPCDPWSKIALSLVGCRVQTNLRFTFGEETKYGDPDQPPHS